MADDDPVRVTDADRALHDAQREKAGPNRLKALRQAHLSHAEDARILVHFVQTLRGDPTEVNQRDAAAAIARWLAIHGAGARSQLPAEVLAFADRGAAGAAASAGGEVPAAAAGAPVEAPAAAAPPRPVSLTGVRVDRYEILQSLGASEWHQVYAGVFTDPDARLTVSEPVVMRYLPSEAPGRAESLFLLHRTVPAGILRLRTHFATPNGERVGVYDARHAATVESLRRDRGLSATDALRIVGALTRAVAEVHAAGGAHGDLRPELVLARAQDTVWDVQLLPGWARGERGTRLVDARHDAWFENAALDGKASDLFSLAKIAHLLLHDVAPASTPLGVLLRDGLAAATRAEPGAAGILELYGTLEDVYGWGHTKKLKDWSFRRFLGAGSLGLVFEATHPERGTRAIKFLRSRAHEQRLLARFTDQALVRLRHDHLVYVEDADSDGLCYYEILELLSGHTLGELLARSEPIKTRQAIDWLKDLCKACTVLHLHDFAHLDVRPSNVFIAVRPDGTRRAVLLDYRTGARLSGTSTGVTALGGEPEFVAPELTRRPISFCANSDVYSAGAILDALLAHAEPDGLAPQLHELSAAMKDRAEAARPDFSVVYFRLLDLDRPAAEAPVAGEPVRRRNPWLLAAVLALVLAAATSVFWYLAHRRAGAAEARRAASADALAAAQTENQTLAGQVAKLDGELQAVKQELGTSNTSLADTRAALSAKEGELARLQGHEAELGQCDALETYDQKQVDACERLGSTTVTAKMKQLRDREIERLTVALHAESRPTPRRQLAQQLRKLDPANISALTAVLSDLDKQAACPAARSAADELLGGKLELPKLTEQAWSAIRICGRPEEQRRALAELATISKDTRPVVQLLMTDPLEGLRVAKTRAPDDKTLCGYLNEAIQQLAFLADDPQVAKLRTFQRQHECKGIARVVLTGDSNSFLVVQTGTSPPERKVPKPFELPAPGTFKIRGKWTWAGSAETETIEVPLALGPDEEKAFHLRRVNVTVKGGKAATITLSDENQYSSTTCTAADGCSLGVLFAANAVAVKMIVDPGADLVVVRAEGCTLRGNECSVLVRDTLSAQNALELKLTIGKKPELSVAIAGTGTATGDVDVTPVACVAFPCSLNIGEPVTLVARPAAGSVLAGWDGCPREDDGGCHLQPEAGKSYRIIARFEPAAAPTE